MPDRARWIVGVPNDPMVTPDAEFSIWIDTVFEIQTFDKGLEIVVFDILRRLHHPCGAVQTLQIDIHPTIQRLKPVFGDAGEFGLGRGAVHSRAFSVDPEGHEKADNDQNQI